MTGLAAYGYDTGWSSALAEHGPPRARPGRVVRVDRGECTVMTDAGALRVLSDSTRAQGDIAPATGDWVAISEDDDVSPWIASVLPRRTVLARRDPSERVIEQVMVANVDHVLIVHGLDRPLPPGRLERMLVLAWDSGADVVIVLAKADVKDVHDARGVARALAAQAAVIEVSRQDGRGVVELRERIAFGTTAALIGESGAGKSNLVNLLVGEAVQATGKVRARDAKGRHTTVARQMHLIPHGGAVVDTPGIRAVGIWGGEEVLHRVYHDIDELSEGCRFSDCAHDREPGCAVLAAVDRSELSGARLGRYHAMVDEILAVRRPGS